MQSSSKSNFFPSSFFILSQTLMLKYGSRTPNFFEVFIEKPDKDLTLKLTQENEHQAVWTCVIQKGQFPIIEG